MSMLETPSMRGSRNFRQGGVQVSLTKKALIMFCVFFLAIIFQGSREGPTFFSMGGPTFSRGGGGGGWGGVQLLIPYRNPYNL